MCTCNDVGELCDVWLASTHRAGSAKLRAHLPGRCFLNEGSEYFVVARHGSKW